MYNRYIPNGSTYTRVVENDTPPRPEPSGPAGRAPAPPPTRETPPPQPHQNRQPPPLFGAAFGEGKSWLSGLLKQFKLDELDSGDILLLLIILFLFIDGDDLELVITLGLLLLFGLGGKEEKPQPADSAT